MFAQVQQRRPSRQKLTCEHGGRRRDQHLPAITHRHEPAGSIDGRAIVVASPSFGFTRVDAHASLLRLGSDFPPGRGLKPLLGSERSGQRTASRLKSSVDAIAGGFDDMAFMLCDGLTENGVVAG